MAPLKTHIQSIYVVEEPSSSAAALAADEHIQASATADNTSTYDVTSANFNDAGDNSYVGNVLEVTSATGRGDTVLILAFDDASNTVTTTPFRVDPGSSATFRI